MGAPKDTIAAIATPVGEGGISVIRISGPESPALLLRLFHPATGRFDSHPQHVHFGEIRDPETGQCLDQVLATRFKAPHSYTGEDVVEISGHGGVYVPAQILQLVLRHGARLAEPGEFTRRAFLNGKMDLSQAEAVADIIIAASEAALRSALSQLQGKLSERLNAIYDRLVGVLAQLEAAIDFPEEGLEFGNTAVSLEILRTVHGEIESLVRSHRTGKIYRDGAKVALVGKPNVGKSSLLNALLQEDRAIVTPHPGTTRDILEERVRLKDIHICLIDSAGLRHHPEAVEAEGIARTRQALARADLAVVLFDGSRPLDDNDRLLIDAVGDKPKVVAINKSDLPRHPAANDAHYGFSAAECVRISAKTGAGIDALEDKIYAAVLLGKRAEEPVVITRERHRELLAKAGEAITHAEVSLQQRLSEELVAVDINQALEHIGAILGKTFADDLLDAIFNQFCIGK
jgi:tRNA modification GTPase